MTRGHFFSWESASVLRSGLLLPLALPCGVPLLTLETETGQLRDEEGRGPGQPRRDPEETQEPAGVRAGGMVVVKGTALTGQV